MRIFLGGHLSYYHPEKDRWLEIDLPEPTPLVDLLNQANIPPGEVSLIVINGALAELQETIVSEGDELKLFSPVGGG